MKILVVGGHSGTGEGRQMQDYADYFQEVLSSSVKSVDVNFCYLDELLFDISSNDFSVTNVKDGRSVESYDMVIFRGKIRAYSHLAFCLSLYLKQKRVKFFNNYENYRGPFTKVGQAIVMQKLALPQIHMLYCDDQAQLLKSAQALRFPLIVKDILGAHGEHNYLVKSKQELEDIFKQNPKQQFLVQEFIPNDCDYRVLVAGSQHMIIKRQANGETHLNNTSQGGTAVLVKEADFPSDTLEKAHLFARELGMEIAGVDVMENKDTGELLFLEINSQPQLVTGAFTEEKKQLLASYFAEQMAG